MCDTSKISVLKLKRIGPHLLLSSLSQHSQTHLLEQKPVQMHLAHFARGLVIAPKLKRDFPLQPGRQIRMHPSWRRASFPVAVLQGYFNSLWMCMHSSLRLITALLMSLY